HPSGTVSRLTYANGVVSTLTLDARLRPDGLRIAQASGPSVLDLSYVHDAVGNVERIADAIDVNNGMIFRYDSLDRLAVAGGPWGALRYEYNGVGDRTLEQLNGEATDYTYNARGQLQQLSGRINLDFVFDSFGRTR